MAGEITNAVNDADESSSSGSTTNGHGSSTSSSGKLPQISLYSVPTTQNKMIIMPAGIFGDIVGGLSGTIGSGLGSWFGNRAVGQTVGEAAGVLIKGLSPWSVIPPDAVKPQSTGPGAGSAPAEEALLVAPAGFITGLLGGVGGKLLGGAVGGLFGNKKLGASIGGAAGGALGSIFGPFSVVPPENLTPQTERPSTEAMVLVPAGWFGHLLGGVARTVGQAVGGNTAETVGNIAGDLAEKFVPWGAVPPNLVPASAGPAGSQQTEDMLFVPASWFGKIASTFGGTIGKGIGGWLGNAQAGEQIGDFAGKLIDAVPFSVLPDDLAPASAGPDGGSEEDKLLLVPAGVIGGLLGSLGGLVGGAVGGLFGSKKTGTDVGNVVGGLAEKFLPWSSGVEPFSVVPATALR